MALSNGGRSATGLRGAAPSPTSRFDRHPIVTLTTVVLVTVLVLDVALVFLYATIAGSPFHFRELFQPLSIERKYRRQNTVYHHDLAKKFGV